MSDRDEPAEAPLPEAAWWHLWAGNLEDGTGIHILAGPTMREITDADAAEALREITGQKADLPVRYVKSYRGNQPPDEDQVDADAAAARE